MRTVRELRSTLSFHPHEINSSIRFFSRENIDWDVYLPTRGINLQRGFLWSLDQKREIIWSILVRRHIPRMAVICDAEGVYQIIDGKQRLSAMIGFYKGMFSLMIDGKEYLFNDLTEEYQRVIAGYHFAYYIVHEESLSKPFTDQDKIDWFIFINFAGTPQERTHLNDLHSSLTSFKAKDIADAQQAYSSENKPLPPFPKDREVYDQAD